jgi:hypothetical protein
VQVGDRLLKKILVRLSRDEARHFSFFADMIRLYLERYGVLVVESIREVIAGFRMPLAGTIKGYWRRALKMADTARCDTPRHTSTWSRWLTGRPAPGRRGRRARRLRQRVSADSGRRLASIPPEGVYCLGRNWWGDYVCY